MVQRAMTVRQAAELLQVSEKTVRKLCREGKLGAFKVGGLWRIPTEDRQATKG